MLIEWFMDEKELRGVVGGRRWWQVRGLDGVEGEWVTERSFLGDNDISEKINVKEVKLGRQLDTSEVDILKMEELERVMVRASVSVKCPALIEFSFAVLCAWRYSYSRRASNVSLAY